MAKKDFDRLLTEVLARLFSTLTTIRGIDPSEMRRTYRPPCEDHSVLIKEAVVWSSSPHLMREVCNDNLFTFGKACARILTALSTDPSNDILQAVQQGSLFSDVLQENWRHELTSYKIVSFYERIGNIYKSLRTGITQMLARCRYSYGYYIL